MQAVIDHEDYEEVLTYCFTINVEEQIEQVDEQILPVLAQEYQVLPARDDYFVMGEYGTELGPYNVKQPVPFIEDITVDGLLSIGWDRALKQRDDFEELNPSKVAVRLEDTNSRRRSLIYRHEGWYKN